MQKPGLQTGEVKVFSGRMNLLQKSESKKDPNNIQKMIADLKLLELGGKQRQEKEKG